MTLTTPLIMINPTPMPNLAGRPPPFHHECVIGGFLTGIHYLPTTNATGFSSSGDAGLIRPFSKYGLLRQYNYVGGATSTRRIAEAIVVQAGPEASPLALEPGDFSVLA